MSAAGQMIHEHTEAMFELERLNRQILYGWNTVRRMTFACAPTEKEEESFNPLVRDIELTLDKLGQQTKQLETFLKERRSWIENTEKQIRKDIEMEFKQSAEKKKKEEEKAKEVECKFCGCEPSQPLPPGTDCTFCGCKSSEPYTTAEAVIAKQKEHEEFAPAAAAASITATTAAPLVEGNGDLFDKYRPDNIYCYMCRKFSRFSCPH